MSKRNKKVKTINNSNCINTRVKSIEDLNIALNILPYIAPLRKVLGYKIHNLREMRELIFQRFGELFEQLPENYTKVELQMLMGQLETIDECIDECIDDCLNDEDLSNLDNLLYFLTMSVKK